MLIYIVDVLIWGGSESCLAQSANIPDEASGTVDYIWSGYEIEILIRANTTDRNGSGTHRLSKHCSVMLIQYRPILTQPI